MLVAFLKLHSLHSLEQLMMTKKFIPYAQQSLSAEDLEAVREALSQPIITRGTLVAKFEKEMASYCGADYAVAFNSGSSALMGAYYAAGIGAHDSVITTPNSFIATVGTAIQQKATPIFVDLKKNSGNIDLDALIGNLNRQHSRGKTAIVPVHFAGLAIDMELLYSEVSTPDTVIIEDAAHALGSAYSDNSKVGSCRWSDMTIFSFHPAKNITTGEGGMVVTNREDLYHRLLCFRNNGIEKDKSRLQGEAAPWYYEVVTLSSNFNFTEMQAALGLSQLKRLDSFIAKRKHLMDLYRKELSGLSHVSLLWPEDSKGSAPNLCVVYIDCAAYGTTRKKLMEELLEQGIGTQLHYIPLYRHPAISKLTGAIDAFFPEMENHYAKALTLPLYFDMEDDDVAYVTAKIKEILRD